LISINAPAPDSLLSSVQWKHRRSIVDQHRDNSAVRDILVHVDASAAGRARVEQAAKLATRLDARLHGLHVMPPADVPHRYRAGDVETVRTSIASRLSHQAAECARIFDDEARRAGAISVWSAAAGDVVPAICHRARYADLVVLGQYETQEPVERHPLPIANGVVLRCGRPVLVVPEAASLIGFEKVVIAWDGSREAVRAAHDALPLLARAHSVQILKMVAASGAPEPTDTHDLAAHLVHHGVRVDANILEMKSAAEHAHLRDQIDQGGYDLVVMGAYSRPPWFEFVFGGATESILSSSAIPVLVAH